LALVQEIRKINGFDQIKKMRNKKIQIWVSQETRDNLYKIKGMYPKKTLQQIIDEAVKEKNGCTNHRKIKKYGIFPKL
jgi:hypothetical protein